MGFGIGSPEGNSSSSDSRTATTDAARSIRGGGQNTEFGTFIFAPHNPDATALTSLATGKGVVATTITPWIKWGAIAAVAALGIFWLLKFLRKKK